MTVKPVPDGYHAVTPYLVCSDASRALEFYKKAFQAEEIFRMPGPGGRVMHAEMRIGDSMVMLADEFPEMGHRSPASLGGAGVSIMLYVKDADAVFQRAIDAGAKVKQPMKNQFYGDRSGTLEDPSGHVWTIGTHVEDVPHEELERRMKSAGHAG